MAVVRKTPFPLLSDRSRSRSPGRPQLALVICPDYDEYRDMASTPATPHSSSPCLTRAGGGSRFPYPASPRQLAPHALARTRGFHPVGLWETGGSLPCSPVLARLGPLSGRELSSLPGSPTLPRIHISEVRRTLPNCRYAQLAGVEFFLALGFEE
jgi:hypothetical protein